MRRFQLSLRDVFILITALCVFLGLFVVFSQLPDQGRLILVTSLWGVAYVGVPLAIAVAIANPSRNLPTLSFAAGFALIFLFSQSGSAFDPSFQIARFFTNDSVRHDLYSLMALTTSVSIGLLCAWITRSLLRPISA